MRKISIMLVSVFLSFKDASASEKSSLNLIERLLSHASTKAQAIRATQSSASVPNLEATYIVYGMSVSASKGMGEILEGSKGLEVELHYRKEN